MSIHPDDLLPETVVQLRKLGLTVSYVAQCFDVPEQVLIDKWDEYYSPNYRSLGRLLLDEVLSNRCDVSLPIVDPLL